MITLFSLYWPSILAAALSAAALSMAGAFLATRQAGVQTLAVSQAAGLGVSLGMLIVLLYFENTHVEHTVLPLLLGLFTSALGFISTEWIARRSHSPTIVYLCAFALFWGLSQLFTGFFPIVEKHATALYFGDIVTLTRGESYFFMLLASFSLLYFLLSWRKQAERAFFSAILEERVTIYHPVDLFFYLIALLLICFSVQLLGLLFTISALFLPTAIYSFSPAIGVKTHILRITKASALAASIGFSLSLIESRFLTTPLITIVLAIIPLTHLFVEKKIFKCN